jgi:hypothetical protein
MKYKNCVQISTVNAILEFTLGMYIITDCKITWNIISTVKDSVGKVGRKVA